MMISLAARGSRSNCDWSYFTIRSSARLCGISIRMAASAAAVASSTVIAFERL
jgi:hypothetical protein